MEMGRAINYIFEDKQWLSKLLPLVLIGFIALIPIIGWIIAAIGVGFMVQLAKNVREGLPRPLPGWNDWQVKLEIGGQVMLAAIAYNLPIILMSMCSYALLSGLASGFLGSIVYVLVFCCVTPIFLLYTLIAWSMLAIGVTEYLETNDFGRIYHFMHLWDVLRVRNTVVFQWVIVAFFANLALGLIGAIPCIGWIVFFLFAYPIQGHLLGQLAHRLSVKKKPEHPHQAART